MDKIFEIPVLNPIRFVVENLPYDASLYYSKGFDNYLQKDSIRLYQDSVFYNQKYTLEDRPTIQILSDWEPTAALYRCSDMSKVADITVNIIPTEILDKTFLCYEFSVDFTEVGEFYLIVEYVNDDDETISYVSEPLEIKAIHTATLLFEYKNSYNFESIVFDTGWIGLLRLEGEIIDFKPGSIDTIYTDEIHDTTIVSSTPFRQFTLSLGLIPDYMIDKINRVLSCDEVKTDGYYYCKSEGAQWEENRPVNSPLSGQSIAITESENKFQLQFDTSFATEDMVIIQKNIRYLSISSDIEIINVFKQFTKLESVEIINRGAPFEITVATESTGNADDFTVTHPIINRVTSLQIPQLFDLDKRITITGITGGVSQPINLFVLYKNLNATAIGSENPYAVLGKNAIVEYYELSPGDFAADFDILSGLGITGTSWDGWAVCDGNHGTPDLRDRVTIGNDGITNQVDQPAGQTGGSWLKRILITHLPKIGPLAMFGDSSLIPPGGASNLESYIRPTTNTDVIASMVGPNGYDQYRVGKSAATSPTIGGTGITGTPSGDGTGTPIDNFDVHPLYMRVTKVMKIVD